MKKYKLASRGDRIVARLLDSALVVMLCVIIYFPNYLYLNISEDVETGVAVIATAVVIFFYVYQIYLLTTTGQTVGKRLVKIRVVKNDTETVAGFTKNVLIRELLSDVIDVVIPIYGLANIAFLFGKEKRCLHDRLAGTKVVDVSGEWEI